MKKFISILLLAGMLLLSFTACNSGSNEAPDSDTTHSHDHSHTESYSETTSSATDETDKTSPSADSSDKADSSKNNSKAVTRGTFSSDKYKNTTLNLSFTLPSGWTFYSDKELCTLSGLSTEDLSDFTNIAENNPAVYDMYAIHKESGASVSLCYENLLYTTGSTLTAKEYLEFIKAAVQGANISQIEDHGTVDFCSGSYEKATITSGSANTRQTHYLKAYNQYMVTIIITSHSATEEADIVKMFN